MWTVRASSAVLLSLACGPLLARVDAQVIVFPGEDVHLGVNPGQLASADLDGDSFPDFASMRQGSNVVTIVISNGAGGFEQTRFQTFGTALASVALRDINSDGKADLLVGLAASLEVRLGYGNGNFAASEVSPNCFLKSGTLIADVNGDTLLDIVGTSPLGSWVFSMGNGVGGFTPMQASPGLGENSRTVFGDLNNDAKLDLISSTSGHVYVQLGNGSGGFAAGALTSTWATTYDITVGDWNGDGNLDCAVASGSSLATNPNQVVTTFLGNGLGGLHSRVDIYAVGVDPQCIASADLNNDGKRDIVVATSSGQVTVLANTGTGFTGAGPYAIAARPQDLFLHDIDNDGDLDLSAMQRILGQNPGVARISNLLGNGAFGFVAPSSSFTPLSVPVGANTVSVALGDLNGDSIQDICSADQQLGRIAVSLAQGGGGFSAPILLPANGSPRRVALADMDSNGTLDIVSANKTSNVISVRFGNGSGAFAAAIESGTLADPQDLAIGDLNADGHPDVVAIDRAGASTAWIALGLGDGAFWPPTARYAGQLSTAVALADVNLDGKLDLIVSNEGTDDVSVAYGNGVGGFGSAIFYVVADGPRDLAVGDVNGDGRPDIAVACYNVVSLLMGGVPPGFGTHTVVNTAAAPLSVALGDVDFDGRLDIVTGHTVNRVCWLRGNGQAGFEPYRQYLSNNLGEDVRLGDVTGDGKLDAVSVGATHASILVNQVQVPTPTSFCFGDGTSNACPCGISAAGNGCPNSVVPSGGRLSASGVANVSNDSFTLTGTSLPSGPGLLFQGTAPLDAALNDGKVCAGGDLLRLGVAFANGNASQFPSTSASTRIGILGALPIAGGLRYYQLAYRDTDPGFCTSFTHNMTNGIAVAWIP